MGDIMRDECDETKVKLAATTWRGARSNASRIDDDPGGPSVEGHNLMSTWLILTRAGELLGEVEAVNLEEATSVANGHWPDQADSLLVWSKDGLEQIRRERQRTFRRRRWQIAYHEAGHAVMARHVGLAISGVRIGPRMNESGGAFTPDADSFGQTTFADASPGEGLGVLVRASLMILVVMAGPMAEYRRRGRPDWASLNRRRLRGSDGELVDSNSGLVALNSCGCWTDPRAIEAGTIDESRHRRCVVAFREHCTRITASVMDELWPRVEAVAVELERRRTLSGAELDDILSRV
jgi:hypothetical protein